MSSFISTSKARNATLLLVWALCVAIPCVLLAQSQARSRHYLEQRFGLRASIASRFIGTYVEDLISSQRAQALDRLSGRRPSAGEFSRVAHEAGYSAAVLLNQQGRVLSVLPSAPALLGKDLTGKYEHLRLAVGGHVAVSKVVPSAVQGLPIVAFAVPFQTPYGRRVYSGAYDIARTPLGSFLKDAIPIVHAGVYLVDPTGTVIASNGAKQMKPTTLASIAPGLAVATRRAHDGSYEAGSTERRFAGRAIAGTPWRLVVAAPSSSLFQSLRGASRWLPWVALVAFAVLGLLAVLLLHKLLASRARLATLNRELERVARIDSLTGVHNRRHIEEALRAALSAARRHQSSLALLLIDIDHFKAVNDRYGHAVGDLALCGAASEIESSLRVEDILGRWGGEEFVAVLPGTDAQDAVMVAERLRKQIGSRLIDLPGAQTAIVTVTIGVAAWTGQGVEELIHQADAAMYAGKSAGRDTVKLHQPASAPQPTL